MARTAQSIALIFACSLLCSATLGCAPESLPLPFSTTTQYFTAYDTVTGEQRPFFIKGTNLGVGLPGRQPGELAISKEQYIHWFDRMKALGIDVFRVYTLHHPRFYETLYEYNEAHPDDPMWIFHGLWLDEENPTGGYDLDDQTTGFTTECANVIDAVHGNAEIAPRYGKAYGSYAANISDYIVGWIAGREIFPEEVEETNRLHEAWTSYDGQYLRLPKGTPTEVWSAKMLDYIIGYEFENYEVMRPISMSSWPTLDPLHHISENHFASGEDAESLDLANIDMFAAKGGYFANFHAYPYYPNFVSEDPVYRTYEDAVGPNSYLGYITDLVNHYDKHPVLIGEFGIPSSWGNAHYGHSGMNHGGHTEVEKGEGDGRLLNNIYEAGAAGGLQFAWFDEWWKRTWITDERDMPRARFRLWPNMTAAEQNFGLITFDPPPPNYNDWPAKSGSGRIMTIRRAHTVAFFFVRVELSTPLQVGETITVGFDTYSDERGETILPDGATSQLRHEFAAVYQVSNEPDPRAQLYVTQAYDMMGIWHDTAKPEQLFHSIPSDGAPWHEVWWKNDGEHGNDDGSIWYPESFHAVGSLRVGMDGQKTSHDGVIVEGNIVTFRIPWTLLHVTDPSTRSVTHDDRATPEREFIETEGFAVTVSLDGEVVDAPDRYIWARWNSEPVTIEREKPSLQIFADALQLLPFFLD